MKIFFIKSYLLKIGFDWQKKVESNKKNSQIVEKTCVENFWVGTWTVETKGKKRIFVENPN